MGLINLNTHYTANELSIILGSQLTNLYSYKEELEMEKNYLPSGRLGYIISIEKFEIYLETKKTYPFTITEFAHYKNKKRPIIRQFLSTHEVKRFLDLVGDPYSIHTISRRARDEEMPSYRLTRKHHIPIMYLKTFYNLPDSQLDKILIEVLHKPYTFSI